MKDTIAIDWLMDAQRPGIDKNPVNPLHRSLAQLISTGKPFSRLSLAFLQDENDQLRWFGSFAQGKRAFFFPGFSTAFDGIDAHPGQNPKVRKPFDFDHLSLEHDRRHWHLTTKGSTDHLGSPRTLELGDGRYLWFGLSFGSVNSFLPVYDQTRLEFSCPSSDADRRRKAIMDAREDAEFPILSLPDGALKSESGTYFHTSVIAGPPGFDTYLGGEHAFPIGSPYLATPFPDRLINLPSKIFRLSLSADTDLQITLMRLRGRLLVPVTFTGPQDPQTTKGNV